MARSAPHPSKKASDSGSFYPPEDGLPTLPAIDWGSIGATAPTVLPASGDALTPCCVAFALVSIFVKTHLKNFADRSQK